jgi:hypothetical protein
MWETRAKPEPGRAFRRGSNLEDRAAMPLLPTALIDRIDVGANQIDIRLRPRRLSALLGIATSAFTCRLGPRLNWERASTPTMIEEIRFAADLYGAFPVKRLFLGFAASSLFGGVSR